MKQKFAVCSKFRLKFQRISHVMHVLFICVQFSVLSENFSIVIFTIVITFFFFITYDNLLCFFDRI